MSVWYLECVLVKGRQTVTVGLTCHRPPVQYIVEQQESSKAGRLDRYGFRRGALHIITHCLGESRKTETDLSLSCYATDRRRAKP